MFGHDPESIYQDDDIEMLEAAFAALDPNAWKCEYRNCDTPSTRKGVCESHYHREQREMQMDRR